MTESAFQKETGDAHHRLDAASYASRFRRIQEVVARLAAKAQSASDITARSIVVVPPSPGIPQWSDTYRALAKFLQIEVPAGLPPDEAIRMHLTTQGELAGSLFWRAYSSVAVDHLQVSHQHLANLAANGWVDIIISTSWDNLLEVAFSTILKPYEYRVLSWGADDDDAFERELFEHGRPTIVKINGDLHSQVFPRDPTWPRSFLDSPIAARILTRLFSGSVVISCAPPPGEVDLDYESMLATCAGATLVLEVSAASDSRHYSIWFSNHSRVTSETVSDFDIFIVELDREMEMRKRRLALATAVQENMIKSLELGAASIPFSSVALYVQEFAHSLQEAQIDCIAYIDDPIAPGGTEIWRRLARTSLGSRRHLRVPIITASDNRVIDRHATVPGNAEIPVGSRVAVVDSVSFSGSTLLMAVNALKARFADIELIPAVLVASKGLVQRREQGERWLEHLIYERVTERHDLSFPWGTTYSTDRFARTLDYASPARVVEVFRRPWGSGEVFATAENCSARLLAIEASQKLSFQRHICRDEFFVALDDGVGIDISVDDFAAYPPQEFDSRIESLTLEEGDYLLVPRGVWHRVRASRTRVRILELAFGIYDEEFDIERLLDMYGRADARG